MKITGPCLTVLVAMMVLGLVSPPTEAAIRSRSPAPQGEWVSGKLTVDGRERTYLLYIPAHLDPQQRHPLLLGFHGGDGDGRKFARQTGFPALAGREGFIAVFPDGIEHSWNDGRGTTYAERLGVVDVAFVRALIEHLKSILAVDLSRIFATGVSNGGMFTQRLGCEMADVFAAIGSDVGPIASDIVSGCNPTAPISVVAIQGTADPGVPIEGGDVSDFWGLGAGGMVESADATMRLWADKNGCEAEALITSIPPEVKDGTRVTLHAYGPCHGTEVHYYIVDGMGHAWPPKQPQAPRLAGPTSHNIDATQVFWEFFQEHPKQVTLSVSVQGQGTVISNPTGISCLPECDTLLPLGAAVELVAQPRRGYDLLRWEGACGEKNPVCAIHMDGEQTVTAIFRRTRRR